MEPQLPVMQSGSPPPCGEGLGVGASDWSRREVHSFALAAVISLVGT